LLSKIQRKILAIVACLASDITMIAWLYFISTNYNRYNHTIGSRLDSPDFQIQFYEIMLRSLTFALLLFLVAQTVVYVLAWRGLRSAYFYLKLFCVLGFAICLYVTIMKSLFALLPLMIYLFGYYTFASLYSEETAKLQNLHQSTTL
jgi:hypothetical protein